MKKILLFDFVVIIVMTFLCLIVFFFFDDISIYINSAIITLSITSIISYTVLAKYSLDKSKVTLKNLSKIEIKKYNIGFIDSTKKFSDWISNETSKEGIIYTIISTIGYITTGSIVILCAYDKKSIIYIIISCILLIVIATINAKYTMCDDYNHKHSDEIMQNNNDDFLKENMISFKNKKFLRKFVLFNYLVWSGLLSLIALYFLL